MNDWIYFDDCRHSNGVMIEAKGTGYQDMMEKGLNNYPWVGAENKMITQANNQITADNGRPIVWYFAEKKVADYMRKKFEYLGYKIIVIYQPMIAK